MKVKRNTLLLLACLVWSAAGFNILRIGLSAYPAYRAVVNYLLSPKVLAIAQKDRPGLVDPLAYYLSRMQ